MPTGRGRPSWAAIALAMRQMTAAAERGSRRSVVETAAEASVVKLGKLAFETLLVGHGDPILTGASGQVRALGGG